VCVGTTVAGDEKGSLENTGMEVVAALFLETVVNPSVVSHKPAEFWSGNGCLDVEGAAKGSLSPSQATLELDREPI
jgi:peptide deformylase